MSRRCADTQATRWAGGSGFPGVPAASLAGLWQNADGAKVADYLLVRGHWIGKYEQTQGEWEAVMGSNPSNFASAGATFPVENVSWLEAVEFCRRLTDRERTRGTLPPGWEYALPSEAQWECAFRAATEPSYRTGNHGFRPGAVPSGTVLGRTRGSFVLKQWQLTATPKESGEPKTLKFDAAVADYEYRDYPIKPHPHPPGAKRGDGAAGLKKCRFWRICGGLES